MPFVEELALLAHDAVHHLDHRAAALLDRGDEPLRGVELALDELPGLLLLAARVGALFSLITLS